MPDPAADPLELRRLVDRYAIEADRHDGDAVAALFVSDGRLLLHEDGDASALPTRQVLGREAITAAIASLGRYRRTRHVVARSVADVVDDCHATAVTHGQAHHLDHQGVDRVLHLRYLDDLVKVAGEWCFDTRHLVVDRVEHRPIDP